MAEKTLSKCTPPLVGCIKLNFDRCSLGNPEQLVIEWLLMDHHGTLIIAFSKHVGVDLAIEAAKILALLEGLKLAKPEGLSNLLVEGDSTVVLFWVNKKEQCSWKFDGAFGLNFYFASDMVCFFCWIPCSAHPMADIVAKRRAKNTTSFLGEFLPPWN